MPGNAVLDLFDYEMPSVREPETAKRGQTSAIGPAEEPIPAWRKGLPPKLPLDDSVLHPCQIQVDWVAGLDGAPGMSFGFEPIRREDAEAILSRAAKVQGDAHAKDALSAFEAALGAGGLGFNGVSIVIDREGRVLDGLARLKAVRETGVAIVALVVRGVDPSAMAAIDLRLARSQVTVLKERRKALREAWEACRDRSGWRDPALLPPGVEVRQVDLTPERALSLIKSRAIRGLPWRRADKDLVRDVKEGRFLETGQALVLDEDGLLREGARRCHAVIEAMRPIRVLLVYGIPRDTPEIWDLRASSTLGRALQRLDYEQGWDMASALRVLARLDEGHAHPTQVELYGMVRFREGLEGVVAAQLGYQGYLMQSVGVAVRAWIGAHRSPDEAERFLSDMLFGKAFNGASSERVDPDRVRAGKRERLRAMDAPTQRAARLVWRVIGDTGYTRGGGTKRQDAVVRALLRAFLIARGERVRVRRRNGFVFPAL